MDPDELRTLLDLHQEWLESFGHAGARFDLSGQILEEISFKRINQERFHVYACQFEALMALLAKSGWNPGLYRQEQNHLMKNMGRANLARANFEATRIGKADLRNCNFVEARFAGADMSGANFKGSDFSHADLTACNLEGANLDHCRNLTCEQLLSARINQETIVDDTLRINWVSERVFECENLLFPGSDLSHRNFRHRGFPFVDLSNAKMTDCDLMEASFLEANLEGVDFRGSRFHKTNFMRANLAGANFSGTQLWNCHFVGANLAGADFRGAELRIAKEGLSVEQLRSAIIDDKTFLMDHIKSLL